MKIAICPGSFDPEQVAMSNERKQSKLDELIQQYCPDGVEYKELQAILKIKNGSDYKAYGEGDIPVYGSGGIMTYIDRYVYNKPSVLIPRKGSIDKLYYVDTPFWNVDTIFYTEINTDLAIPRYVYHCLLREHLEQYNTAGGVPSLTQKVLNKIQIPLPPLEVQSEIVRILDNFTELTAELTARKKQYEFYRDKLLTISNEQVAMCNLGDICESIADGDHMPPPKADTGTPFITILNITEQNKIDFSNTMFVPHAYYDSLAEKRKPQKGDILYTVVGSYGIPVCIEEDSEFVFQRHIAILRPKKQIVKPRYMFHAMQSSAFKAQAGKTAKGAAQKTIGLAALAAMKMPVPTLDVQNRLVNVLDNFDAICSDLKIGLPAEIEARKKQYEFYRDALLTYAATGKIILTDRQL